MHLLVFVQNTKKYSNFCSLDYTHLYKILHTPSLRRWEDNIKMNLQEVGGGRGDWMELAQNKDRWRTLRGTVRDSGFP